MLAPVHTEFGTPDFRTYGDLETIIVRSHERFEQWIGTSKISADVARLKDNLIDRINEAQTAHDTFDRQLAEDRVEDFRDNLVAFFRRVIFSGSRVDKYLNANDVSKDYGKGMYAGMTATFEIGLEHIKDQAKFAIGFSFGLSIRMNKLLAGSKAAAEIASEVENQRADLDQVQNRAADQSKAIEQLETRADKAKVHVDNAAKAAHELEVIVQNLQEQAQQKIESVESTHASFMALRAPAQYWAERHDKYAKDAKGLEFRFFIYVALVGVLSIAAVALILLQEFITIPLLSQVTTGMQLWEKIVLFAFPAGLAIWIGRLLLRQYLCKEHAAEDALFRSTMIDSYLGLLSQSDAAVSPDERKIVLQSVFMPLEDGLVKQDPEPFLFLVNRLGGKD